MRFDKIKFNKVLDCHNSVGLKNTSGTTYKFINVIQISSLKLAF